MVKKVLRQLSGPLIVFPDSFHGPTILVLIVLASGNR